MRRMLTVSIGLVLLASSCSSDSSGSSASAGTSGTGAADTVSVTAAPGETSAASATDVPTTDVPATDVSATDVPATDAPALPSGAFPTDPCAIVTVDDVIAAFGGTVAAGVLDEDSGGCNYDITGSTKTGDVGVFAGVTIGLEQGGYISYDEEKVVFPEVEKIDGLGDEAWYHSFGSQLHIGIGGSELLVYANLPGDDTAGKQEIIDFAKVVLSKLG